MPQPDSRADLMSSVRPLDLPDFRSPPLTEVVLGAQFDVIPGFMTPHLGLIWERFRGDFPHVEEHPPLQPVFETFGPNPQMIGIQFGLQAETPRLIFSNDTRTELLQVQKDRFLHNWRKTGEGDSYPRFERMLQNFENGLAGYVDAIANASLPIPVPNQCEVTYINQIPVAEGRTLSDLTAEMFGQHTGSLMVPDVGEAEDLRFLLRYILRDQSGTPFGRLIAAAEPARLLNGQAIVQLTMTARGRPPRPDSSGITEFLKKGRASVVKGFAHLTSQKMHELWGRTQ